MFFLDDAARLDLAEARGRFGARVIGQGEAVELVADLLATIKAALNRPRRPIASLLFIGPTGVGKTEMATALAEYFFGDVGRLVRFDMSEFATAGAVSRDQARDRRGAEAIASGRRRANQRCREFHPDGV